MLERSNVDCMVVRLADEGVLELVSVSYLINAASGFRASMRFVVDSEGDVRPRLEAITDLRSKTSPHVSISVIVM